MIVAVLFAGNKVAISIDAYSHQPVSLKSPLIFGPLGLPRRLHLLRDLRAIKLTVDITEISNYAAKRHRARIQHFVQIIRAHAEDEGRKSLLNRLDIHLINSYSGQTLRPWDKRLPRTTFDRHMFSLESLAQITGIPSISVDGVPAWFAQCLEMRVRGEGGEIKPLSWPKKTTKRKD
jgi:hypothetical protein